ncbi:hypothetical protein CBS101457_002960 [Exobasidium rhododendri]|nr:hypothetical protein CBS101457_002960 [Exobasidium rhododendri]
MLRASHAATYNEAKSTVNEPFYDHDRSVSIPPGTVISLRIGFWPTGMTLDAGESLVLRVAGHSLVLPEFKVMTPDRPTDFNKGRHTVHTGGQYDSQLIVPVVNY